VKVLVVEPLKPCYVREIEGLKAMQDLVGGHIEAIYPYEEPVAIIDEIVAGLKDKQTPYTVICDRIEAIGWAIDNSRPGDVILLAGKGHEDYQVIGHEKHHMDEREIVAQFLEERKKS